MNQPTKPDSIEFLPLPRASHSYQTSNDSDFGSSWASLYTDDQMHSYAEDHVLADRAHRHAVVDIGDDDVFSELLWAFKFHDDVDGNVIRREKLLAHINALIATAAPSVTTMTHFDCMRELQDDWISEEECNSVDFDAIYGRYSLPEIRAELAKRRTQNKQEGTK